jgi:hypothetical protein
MTISKNEIVHNEFSGLTKHQYIAIAALQGLISKYTMNTPEDQETLSKLSIEIADTFIKEYNKSNQDASFK